MKLDFGVRKVGRTVAMAFALGVGSASAQVKVDPALPEDRRPTLGKRCPGDALLTQGQRFEDRLKILERMIELWEQGQYIGWPS